MQVAMKSPNLNEFTTMDQKRTQMNLVSPVIRGSHSRGARFLDLVKNNKLNVSPQLSRRMSMSKNTVKDIMEKSEKKQENQEYLKFSIRPNLSSSPSSGILSKRKATVDTPDSPGQSSSKRKRVSFNDPVSTTKEYLITEEEERLKSNSLIRCLTYENDGNIEQEDECDNKENILATVDENMEVIIKNEDLKIKNEVIEVEANSYEMDHNYDQITSSPQNADITTSSIEDSPERQNVENDEDTLIFKNKDELMDYVSKNFTFNEIAGKILEQANEEQSLKRKELIESVIEKVGIDDVLNELLPIQDPKYNKMTSEQLDITPNVINHLSKMMKINDRFKHKVLDTLSEKHSKDFLSHALQENSVATVCQKLTIPSIINYLIHKVNICDDDEIDFEINRMNRNIMHHLIKKTTKSHEIITDQKEVQELLKLLFRNMQKIEVLDTVHEFLRSNIIQGPF